MVKGCSKNFAIMEKFDFSAAPNPSAIQWVYKNKGGGGGGGGGGGHTSSFHFLPTSPDQCPGPVALVPCSSLPPVPAAAQVFVALAPIAAEPNSVGAAALAHCRHHQSRAPVVSPLSVSCTRVLVIRALSLLPSPGPPCAHAVHCHS